MGWTCATRVDRNSHLQHRLFASTPPERVLFARWSFLCAPPLPHLQNLPTIGARSTNKCIKRENCPIMISWNVDPAPHPCRQSFLVPASETSSPHCSPYRARSSRAVTIVQVLKSLNKVQLLGLGCGLPECGFRFGWPKQIQPKEKRQNSCAAFTSSLIMWLGDPRFCSKSLAVKQIFVYFFSSTDIRILPFGRPIGGHHHNSLSQ